MSPKQQKLEKLRAQYAKVREKWEAKIKDALDDLKASQCNHSKTETYEWHHGYGKYMTGERCKFCNARRGFVGMGRWQSEEEYWKNLSRDDD